MIDRSLSKARLHWATPMAAERGIIPTISNQFLFFNREGDVKKVDHPSQCINIVHQMRNSLSIYYMEERTCSPAQVTDEITVVLDIARNIICSVTNEKIS